VANIEYASNGYLIGAGGVSTRDVLRTKLRHAPDAIKRTFPTVFPELAKPGAGGTSSRFGGVRTSKSPAIGFLVGSLAPGLSEPVFNQLDGQTLPEVFTRKAWESMLADVAEGRRGELRFGHYGNPVASTDRGTLRFEIHPAVGAMFEARFNANDPIHNVFFHDVPRSGADVSIGFCRSRSKLVTFRGQTMRVVHQAELRHVAIILPGSGLHGVYRAASVLPVRGGDGGRLREAWSDVRVRAWETSKKTIRLTDLYPVTQGIT